MVEWWVGGVAIRHCMVVGVLGWLGSGAVVWVHSSTVAEWHAHRVVRWQGGGLRGVSG